MDTDSQALGEQNPEGEKKGREGGNGINVRFNSVSADEERNTAVSENEGAENRDVNMVNFP